MPKPGEKPPTKLLFVIRDSTGKQRIEGPVTQTEITRGNKTIFVETPAPLQKMYVAGTRQINWQKKEGIYIDDCPVYSMQPPG